MQGHITPFDIANTVRMAHIGRRSTTFLLLEGDTDCRCFRKLIDLSACDLIPCHARWNVITAVRLLNESRETGFLAIIDADFDRLPGGSAPPENCLLTDFHDLTVVLFCSKALEHVLLERGSGEKIREFESAGGGSTSSQIVERAKQVGYFRWLNYRAGHGLKFADFDLGRYVNRETLTPDFPGVIEAIAQRSKCPQHIASFRSDTANLVDNAHEPKQIVNGHDLLAILAVGLRYRLGSANASDVRPENLDIELRLAFDRPTFEGTLMFKDIRSWEEQNSSWKVLA